MTEQEIRQALECCEAYSCSGCPFYKYMGYKCEGADAQLIGLIKHQQAEIKWLKEALQTQTDILESGANSYEPCFEKDKIRAEAIKEFAERLKERFLIVDFAGVSFDAVSVKAIDNLVKEMEDEQ